MSAHAKFSPSAVERWQKCPASIQRSQGVPERESPAAAEGTRGHECLEAFLKNGREKAKRTWTFLSRSYDFEMIDHAMKAAAWIWLQAGPLPVMSEKRVTLEHIDADLWGTLDATVIEHFGTLHIIDYKYGKFVPVDVEANGQLLTYAVGAARAEHYNFDKVKLSIVQPRAPHTDGPFRSWEAPIDELFSWEEELAEAVAAARARKPKASPGSHCFFCAAKPFCPDYTPKATAQLRAKIVAESMARESPEKTKERLRQVFGDPDDDQAADEW